MQNPFLVQSISPIWGMANFMQKVAQMATSVGREPRENAGLWLG